MDGCIGRWRLVGGSNEGADGWVRGEGTGQGGKGGLRAEGWWAGGLQGGCKEAAKRE